MTVIDGIDYELGNYYEVRVADLNEIRLWFCFTITHTTVVPTQFGYAEIWYTIVIDGRVA